MKALVAAALVLLVVIPASAQFAVTAGSSKDWITTATGLDPIELATPMAAVSYDLPMGKADVDGKHHKGLTLSMRGTDGIDMIQEYTVDYWSVGSFEWFTGGKFETWGVGFTGSREFLWGAQAGIRGTSLMGAPIELSGSYTLGDDGKRHIGLFFGMRVATQ